MRNQKGQGVIEYVILSSLVAIFCLVAIKELGGVVKKRIENVKTQLVKNINLQ